MPRTKKVVEPLAVLAQEKPQETQEPLEEPQEQEDDTIQASKVETPVKVKKPRSEAQLAVFKRMKERGNEENAKRKLVRDEANKIQKEAKEEKIISKAITIRRKQVKQQAVLDEVSDDDDTPMPPRKRVAIKPPPPKVPEFIFV